MPTELDHASDSPTGLQELLLAYLEAGEAGRPIDREWLLAGHPEFASELAAFFADYDGFARMAGSLSGAARAGEPTPVATAPAPPAGPGGDLGDYELLEELAAGGIGIVYKARQKSLNRVVALKMIPAGRGARTADLRRFRVEAEAAAQLDHPAIVPIYEVGEGEGRWFFSMQLIEGGSLDRHLGRFRDDPEGAARLLAAVARAVHYAHQRGILHRDLKPANILLDAQGQPHVTDFGLAKRVPALDGGDGQDPLAGGLSLTQSGDLVGTPCYMAPEQAEPRRGRLTTAADVYGLGAILYTVLTGRPPFRGVTVFDTLLQVVQKPPERPRAVCPQVDRDLEAVCLKCLEKDPAGRYPSALALAEDLERWLAGEPVRARRAGPCERAWKWARRRPAAAALLAVSAAAALALALGGVWYNARLEDALESATAERETARREHQRAEANFRRAVDAVDRMVLRLDREELPHIPAVQQVRQAVLLDALEFYKQFLQEKSDDPAVRREAGRAYSRAGDIYRLLGRQQDAVHTYGRALELQERLAAAFPARREYRVEATRTLDQLGCLYQALGRLERAEEAFRVALARWEPLAAAAPDRPAYRQGLARSHEHLGELLRETGRPDEAEKVLRAAVELGERLAADFPQEAHYRLQLAASHNALGRLLGECGRPKLAEKSYREALGLCERLTAEFPAVAEYRLELARSHRNVGVLLSLTLPTPKAERARQAEKALRQALGLCERLAADYPAVAEYRQELARCHTNLGLLFSNLHRSADAEAAFRQGLRLREQLAADYPAVPSYRQELARSQNFLGRLWRDAGRRAEAEKAFQSALALQERLAAERPDVPAYRNDLGVTLNHLGLVARDGGDAEQARQRFGQAVEHHQAALKANPRQPASRRTLFRAVVNLSDALVQLKDHGGLARAAEALYGGVLTGPESRYQAARLLARAVPLAEKDAALPEDQRQERVRAYAGRALDFLREAVQQGFQGAARLRNDPHLIALRGREDFRGLLGQVGIKAAKAAR
jgi:serine/threonine-protein kinase